MSADRPLIQRLANRLGTPFGVLPFPFVNDCSVEGAGEKERVFEQIYQESYWTRGSSDSGEGSELERTVTYRSALLAWLDRCRIGSMFDAPCGDLNWMSQVLEARPLEYIGGDISETALSLARKRCPEAELRRFDICADPFPHAEVWHCRDALFHLSFADIWLALENAARSSIKYALLTTHRARILQNLDIATGSWRFLDLERAPFNFPKASDYLQDYEFGEFPRFVGVWPIEALRDIVARHASQFRSGRPAPAASDRSSG